jgi:hypothetical protein
MTAPLGLTILRVKMYGLHASTPSITASIVSSRKGGGTVAVKIVWEQCEQKCFERKRPKLSKHFSYFEIIY